MINSIDHAHKRNTAEPEEPSRLEKARRNFKGEMAFACAPSRKHGSHHESVSSVRQGVVVDKSTIAGGDPVMVQTFQLVRIANALRRPQIDPGITELNPAQPG